MSADELCPAIGLKHRRMSDAGVLVLRRCGPSFSAPVLAFLGGLGACTWISFRLGPNLASVGFLYLVFVVLAAVYGGFWQATLISVISVGMSRLFFR